MSRAEEVVVQVSDVVKDFRPGLGVRERLGLL